MKWTSCILLALLPVAAVAEPEVGNLTATRLLAGEPTDSSARLQARTVEWAEDPGLDRIHPGVAAWVGFEIAADAEFTRKAVRSVPVRSDGATDFMVKQKVEDLLPSTTYHWRVWLLESREFRDPNPATPSPEKSLWGITQRAWLKETLAASPARLKLILTPQPLVGPTSVLRWKSGTLRANGCTGLNA